MTKIDVASRGFLAAAPDPARYGATYSEYNSSGIICQMVPKGARVLDIGCGDGSVAALLRTRCEARVVGVEPDGFRAEKARNRGVEVYEGYAGTDFFRKHGEFDVILYADVLEHLPDPYELVGKSLSSLAKCGSIVVSIPNAAHWSIRWMILRGRFDYEPVGIMDATHLRWFTRASAAAFLERCGLRVVEQRGTSGTGMEVYCRWPWRWLPESVRWHLVVRLSRVWPTLFACQHVMRAVKAEN